MQIRSLIKSLLASVVFVGALNAQITYESFNYTVGANLAGQTNWISANTGTAPVIASGNLSVTGLEASSGNSVSFAGGNFQEALGAVASVTSGTVYYSLALNLSSLPTGTATYSFALSTGGTNYAAAVWLRPATGGYEIGLSNRSNSAANYSSTLYTTGETVFLVGQYSFVAGAANDTSALWINPAPATFAAGSAPTATLTALGGTDMTAVTQFLLRGAAGSPAGAFDELRVGTTWASVTPAAAAAIPEPSTYAAIFGGLALVGAVVYRRRSRQVSAV
ncbi:PEP-CTERM sorting domain-containing protein [Oleiharenicola lentus]|uniref:PEP-CTERM sorting domain-containing protein n=1 Tax=Oleiharenicola lentus TaxID=2508720 RepID=UPI003F6692A1